MNTNEIDDILQRARRRNLRTTCEVAYLGVFPFDYFPNTRLQSPSNSFYFVFNTDSSTEPGSHWLACYYNHRSKILEFFDSYAQSPEFYNLTIPKNLFLHTNQIPLQSDYSSVCGHYCIFFLVSRLSNQFSSIQSFSRYLSRRFKSKNARDSFVSDKIHSLTKCNHSNINPIYPKHHYNTFAFSGKKSSLSKIQKGTGSDFPLNESPIALSAFSNIPAFFDEVCNDDSDFELDSIQSHCIQCCKSQKSPTSSCFCTIISTDIFAL